MAELEAHRGEEANAQDRGDAEYFLDEVIDGPVAEPRPALIWREGLDIGLKPHDDAEEETHHDQPVRGVD